MTFAIRAARPEEYDAIGAVTVAAYSRLPVDHLWGGYTKWILDTATRAKHADVLVAVNDDRVVGAVTYVGDSNSRWSEWTEPGEAQFRLLAVAVDTRGQGAGEALARACIERAEANNQPLIIHTTKWMEAAQRMYVRLGFERRPDRDAPQSVWDSPPVHDLPDIWTGESFLAYTRRSRSIDPPMR